jgi:hypothetical protein|tara:strand:- start:6 stop:272 length:267 start_codon:yes stop_codon:yes gene_type:complete
MDKCYELYYKDIRDCEEDEETKKQKVFISIQMPEEMMNEKADELGIETTLSFNHTDVFVKAPYNKDHPHSFNMFDADERQEAIEEYIG